MWFFKKKDSKPNDKPVSYVLKCDDIVYITDIVIGSLFSVSVSKDTNDVIITLPSKYQRHLICALTMSEHDGTYITAKLSALVSGGIPTHGNAKMTIVLPKSKLNLERIELSDSAKMNGGIFNPVKAKILTSGLAVMSSEVNTHLLEVEAAGTSSVNLGGEIHTLVIEASGGSNVDAEDVICHNASAKTSGVSDVIVNPSDSMTSRSSGASIIRYRKTVKYKDIKTSGAASKIES